MNIQTNRYYFCDDSTKTVYVCNEFEDGGSNVYLGTSNNPNVKMAVAAFTQASKQNSGYKIVLL
jgi:hypothetical protein